MSEIIQDIIRKIVRDMLNEMNKSAEVIERICVTGSPNEFNIKVSLKEPIAEQAEMFLILAGDKFGYWVHDIRGIRTLLIASFSITGPKTCFKF